MITNANCKDYRIWHTYLVKYYVVTFYTLLSANLKLYSSCYINGQLETIEFSHVFAITMLVAVKILGEVNRQVQRACLIWRPEEEVIRDGPTTVREGALYKDRLFWDGTFIKVPIIRHNRHGSSIFSWYWMTPICFANARANIVFIFLDHFLKIFTMKDTLFSSSSRWRGHHLNTKKHNHVVVFGHL